MQFASQKNCCTKSFDNRVLSSSLVWTDFTVKNSTPLKKTAAVKTFALIFLLANELH